MKSSGSGSRYSGLTMALAYAAGLISLWVVMWTFGLVLLLFLGQHPNVGIMAFPQSVVNALIGSMAPGHPAPNAWGGGAPMPGASAWAVIAAGFTAFIGGLAGFLALVDRLFVREVSATATNPNTRISVRRGRRPTGPPSATPRRR